MTDKRIRDLPALAGAPDPATLLPVSVPDGMGGYATRRATVSQLRGAAADQPFDPAGTGLAATDVQAALAELDGRGTSAADTSFDPAGTGLAATDVQAALVELDGRAADGGTGFRQVTQTFAAGEERVVPLPLAEDLARAVPQVLKFIAAANDQTAEMLSFNAGEESAFAPGALVDFSGVAKPRTSHSLAVEADAGWTGGGAAVISAVIESSQFKSFGA